MTHGVMIRRATTALAAIAGVLATGASSASATSAVNAATATCTAPALAQPFSSASDTNWYAPLPGESWNSFPATGWTLSGGAKVVSATLADGTSGTTLDLPAGAQAVSPGMCVTNDDPSARGEIRMTSGSSSVTVSVAYMGPEDLGLAAGEQHDRRRQHRLDSGHPAEHPSEQGQRLAVRAIHVRCRQHRRVPALELLRRPEDAPLNERHFAPTTTEGR